MTLIIDQIVRYNSRLWRVDYVNSCRARIIPLGKTRIDTESGGINISPHSELPIISDVQRARDEMELEAAERELAEVRSALAGAERAEAAPKPAARPATAGVPGRGKGGWRVGPKPTFRTGSLAARVSAEIAAHPGLSTKELAAAFPADLNVAACVSRFAQAGIIEKC